ASIPRVSWYKLLATSASMWATSAWNSSSNRFHLPSPPPTPESDRPSSAIAQTSVLNFLGGRFLKALVAQAAFKE
ncbi:MAG: hypothetical protein ACP5RH_06060, partial [Leptodesmis sp.]|uniref:hypothetical protein n=1 Tax=Leptodesmis sp. TaxID=3100501 RepID=UPI003D0B7F01